MHRLLSCLIRSASADRDSTVSSGRTGLLLSSGTIQLKLTASGRTQSDVNRHLEPKATDSVAHLCGSGIYSFLLALPGQSWLYLADQLYREVLPDTKEKSNFLRQIQGQPPPPLIHCEMCLLSSQPPGCRRDSPA